MTATPPAQPSAHPGPSGQEDRLHRHLGLVAAVLLGLSTVATAWGAYQTNRWSGVMAAAFNESARLSTDAGKLYQEGDAINSLDATLFVEWTAAIRAGDGAAAADIADSLFSEPMVAAMEVWEAMGPEAPASPFELDEYAVIQWAEADLLEAESQAASERALEANQHGDDYVLLSVLLAAVLFTSGIASTIEAARLKVAFLAGGTVVFVAAAGMMLTYPVH